MLREIEMPDIALGSKIESSTRDLIINTNKVGRRNLHHQRSSCVIKLNASNVARPPGVGAGSTSKLSTQPLLKGSIAPAALGLESPPPPLQHLPPLQLLLPLLVARSSETLDAACQEMAAGYV
ncbi:hypothetical protein POM88_039436 [Heracleum sosnowskyi]|uniref:Uncharacterized protein n=1 Tax=Heracleum sosnowskyi TaxID=360622 RepID=A0AAD8HAD0_9APIA|nr:hypothetical protein POM88_039436 [Heracleum sosnowskyi]